MRGDGKIEPQADPTEMAACERAENIKRFVYTFLNFVFCILSLDDSTRSILDKIPSFKPGCSAIKFFLESVAKRNRFSDNKYL